MKEKRSSIVKIVVWAIVVVLVIVAAILFFIKRNPKIPEATFPTAEFKNASCSYQIPSDWEQYGEAVNDFQSVFVLKGSDMTKSVSNITVNISLVEGKKSTIKAMKKQFGKSFEDAVLGVYPKANNFVLGDYRAPVGEVFTASYTITTETGSEVSCTQYYPLKDFYSIVITAMDAHDGNGDKINEYAKNIVNTLKITKKEKTK